MARNTSSDPLKLPPPPVLYAAPLTDQNIPSVIKILPSTAIFDPKVTSVSYATGLAPLKVGDTISTH